MKRNRSKLITAACMILLISVITLMLSACDDYYKLTVKSDSMEPEFKHGDVIAIDTKVDVSALKEGDIIAYYYHIDDVGDELIAHRITDIIEKDGKRYFQTKADNNDIPDAMTEAEYLPEDKVFGKYVEKVYISKQ